MSEQATPAAPDWEDSLAAWRAALEAALEREGDDLADIPQMEDPGTPEGREAVLKVWVDMVRSSYDKVVCHSAAWPLERSVAAARTFIAAGETSAGVRVQTLRLFASAGVSEYKQGSHAAAAAILEAGLVQARCFLAAGEKNACMSAWTLWMFADAGGLKNKLGNHAAAAAIFEEGVMQAGCFLAAGEASAGVRESTLRLFYNAGVNEAERGNHTAAASHYAAGLQQARGFLAAGETSAGVRQATLQLFSNAGYNESMLSDRAAAAAILEEGLVQALSFLAVGEASAGVREWTLRLFYNAGVIETERGNYAAAASHYAAGLQQARGFLTAGENSTEVREGMLRLVFNSGMTEAEHGSQAAAAAIFEEGLVQARRFLADGEASAEVREGTLQVFTNAGFNEVKRSNFAAAASIYADGLQQARGFLAAGETSAGVRKATLQLFSNAGFNESMHGDRAAAAAIFGEGLEQARSFLTTGETSAGVRETTLRLFTNAGFNESERGDRGAAAAIYEEGLEKARDFLAAGEASAVVREGTLRLFSNAGVNKAKLGMQSPLRQVATRLVWWWARGVMLTDVRPPGGVLNGSDALWAEWFREFLLEWHALERPHGSFGGARDGAGQPLTAVQAALAALEGLLLWESGLRNAAIRARFGRLTRLRRAAAEVVDAWQGGCSQLLRRRRRLQAWHRRCRHHRLLRGFLPGVTRRLAHNRRQLQRPRAAVLWGRYEDLRTSLSEWVLAGVSQALGLTEDISDESDLLLVAGALVAATGPEGLPALLGTWLGGEPPWRDPATRDAFVGPLAAAWPQHSEGPVERWIARLGLPASGLSVAQELRYGPAPVLTPAFAAWAGGDPEPLVALLDGAWARVCREGERLNRVADVLAAGEGIDAVYPPLLEANSRPPVSAKPSASDALLEEVLAWQGLEQGLADEAALLLGVLFAVRRRDQDAEPEVLVRRWQAATPWQDPDGAGPALDDLTRAWFAREGAQRKDRLELALVDRPRHESPPIRRWLRALDLQDALPVEATLANGSAPALERVFAAASRGDHGPLCALLETAWQRAQRHAQTLARLKAALPEGGINAPLAHAIGSGYLTQHNRRSALAAVMRGDAGAHVSSAVASHLAQRARQPEFLEALAARLRGQAQRYLKQHIDAALAASVQIRPQDPLPRLERAAARLYAAAVHLHPGERGEAALTERLHHWARAALQEASAREDLEGLWSALESGRIALSGLALPPPDAAWKADTADLLGKALASSVEGDPENPDWRRGWPPLTAWIQQCEKLRPARITVTACQGRLRPGEALVQPFFLPDSGALQALWLTSAGELQRRDFPSACDEVHWRTAVLDPWAQWLEGITQEQRARVWRKPGVPAPAAPAQTEEWEDILIREPVRQFAVRLADWAAAARIERLILLLPAPLAQLPWESLPDSPLPPGRLVRAVSLTHWRRASLRETEPTPWTFYDVEGLHWARLEAHRVDPAPHSNRTHTSADVLAGLKDHRGAHLIVHGHYQPFAPLRSGLTVATCQFLPLWVPAAIGVGARRVVLSACESNLTGQATTDLLGPVGVGPACVAAGAEVVLGTLWPCHDLAATLFIDQLTRLAEDGSWADRPLAMQVAEAAQRLRRMPGVEVQDLVKRLAERAGEDFGRYETPDWQPYYEAARPFAHPKFWASFVVVGEDVA
jgi:hypothetical protein